MTIRLAVSLALALLAGACAQMPRTEVSSVETGTPGAETPPVPATLPPTIPLPARAAIALPPAEPVAHAAPSESAAAALPELEPQPQPQPEAAASAPPAPPPNLWDRVRKGFAMPDMDAPLVKEWENWYSSRPDYVARMVERSSRYLYHVIEEVERRRMPSEIALLPMIESAYNPVAYSRAHASGIWQFIPSTGKVYGLQQNWWYDGRRDIIAATSAALDYLEKLYGMFGSWDLALASYNWGEGAVGRALARNEARGLPADYASLTMPAETRNYVPKLMAVRNIIANPERLGLELADIPDEPYFATVPVRRHIDVKLAAKLAEMPLDEFKSLNPAHNKHVIKRGAAELIVLPKHKVDVFVANLRAHDKPLVSWQAHTVKAGERPEKIAARYGITLRELKEINGMTDRRRFSPGQPLLVPVVNAHAEPYLPDLPATPVATARTAKAARSAAAARATGTAAQLQKAKVVRSAPAKSRAAPQRPASVQRANVTTRKAAPASRKQAVQAKAPQPAQAVSTLVVADSK